MVSRSRIKNEKGCKNIIEYFQTLIDRHIRGQDIKDALVELSKPQRVRFISWANNELRTASSEKPFLECIKVCESVLKN